MSPWLYRVAGILVSIFFLYLVTRQVDFAQFFRVLKEARPALLGAASLVYLAGYPIRALRWRRILRAQKELSLGQVLVPVFVGYMANNLLPARAGELYRAHFLGRRTRMSRSGALASIVVERTFDGLMLILVISLVFFMFPEESLLGISALATGLVFLALAVGIFLYVREVDRTHRAVNWMLGLLPQAAEKRAGIRVRVFMQGMRGISTFRGTLEVGAYTVLVWTLEACAVALVILSFGVTLPVSGFVLVYSLAALSTALPSGPGYIGPYQYAFVLALGVFAVSRETALAISVAAQASLLGSVTLIGLALLWRDQLRARTLEDREGSEKREKAVV